jgi:hypothetical protein
MQTPLRWKWATLRVCGLAAVVAALVPPASRAATSMATSCIGDCGGGGEVSIDELIVGVNIALGNQSLTSCPAFDGNGDGQVTIDELISGVNNALNGCSTPRPTLTPTPTLTATMTPTVTPTAANLPLLLDSDPAADATDVPRSAWIRLGFAGAVDPAALRGFTLTCDGNAHAVDVSALAPDVLIVNPAGEMPAAAVCTLTWRDVQAPVTLAFATAAAGVPATVHYDRTDTRAVATFPDDVWLTPDAATRTGVRLNLMLPNAPRDVQNLYRAGLAETNKLDGFSPIAHAVLDLSDAPDPTSLPLAPADSLDPLATISIVDLTPGSATRGQRVPFALEIHDDPSPTGGTAHALLLFPSIPLTPGGRYGLVVTRRVLADATRPFEPSSFFLAAMEPPTDSEPPALTAVRPLVGEVLDAAAQLVPPIPRDDVALAVRFSVRSVDDIPLDLLSIKEQVLAAPPPAFTITSVVPDTRSNSSVAAIVSGKWDDPDWRNGANFARGADGRPVLQHTREVEFTLALPKAA